MARKRGVWIGMGSVSIYPACPEFVFRTLCL